MTSPGGSARGRWGTAVALLAVVVLLSALDAVPLVLFPLAILLLAFPAPGRWRSLAIGAGAAAFVLALSGGAWMEMSRGWAVLLGGGFAVATLWRSQWGFFPRALIAVALASSAAALVIVAGQGWTVLDWQVLEHFRSMSALAIGDLRILMPEAQWAEELGAATQRIVRLQSLLFPAVLALQSLAALGFASWCVARLGYPQAEAFELRPLRDFRFSDQLVWLLILGLLLVVLPFGAGATRVGYNVLTFMAGLYALRGVAVFLFLAGRTPTVLSVLFGALAALFLYPLILTAALLVGLGDTWFDVRGRAALASGT